ncbi:GAF domain-containing protein [Sagittula stellata]|uniref:histidine kinase n=1 Tax=Sagittula stellata (strain ATCC 700073 / DSM 11524 / E-37) TaxID=388399 RepID=A3K2L1_SAGS3|nr:GAF domain-containing protein [Sagittula stellata]EBA08420.1 hypothetical protein SSE37_16448 [Sagittula stellata E-37]
MDKKLTSDFTSAVTTTEAAHAEKLADSRRLDALVMTDVMTPDSDEAHERCVRLASRILKAPVSLVSYVDTERQFFKAQCGLSGKHAEERGTPLTHSFCQYVVTSDKPLVVRDSREDPILSQNAAVEDLNVVAYLGVPVHSPSGEVLGSFCVIDSSPREWTAEDLAALEDLVAMLESELTLRQTGNEREILLQEMSHRIKNLFSLVSSMVRLERRRWDTARELADSVIARVDALSVAHEMIVPVVEATKTGDGERAHVGELLSKVLAPHTSDAKITLTGDATTIGPKAVTYVTLAVHELATNSAKYGALSVDDGRLDLRWLADEDNLVLDWLETGHVWTDTAIGGGGFGSQLLKISIEGQLNGALTTEVSEDQFAHRLTLPLERLEF